MKNDGKTENTGKKNNFNEILSQVGLDEEREGGRDYQGLSIEAQ